jgi:chromosome segregation ATPase
MTEEIKALQDEITDLKIRMKVAETNIETVTASVNDIKNNTSKLVWIVGSALVLTILNLIIKGGFIN